jgi:hypothetical protein
VQWLPGEEVTLMLGALAALGLLVLGVLDLVWPARRPRPRRDAAAPVTCPAAAPAPARRADPTEPRPAAPAVDNARRAGHALGIGRALLDRAVHDATLSPERRLMLLQSAIVWLTRGVQFAPDDEELREAVGRTREALWTAFQDIALARLAAETPWGTSALAADAGLAAPRDERAGRAADAAVAVAGARRRA